MSLDALDPALAAEILAQLEGRPSRWATPLSMLTHLDPRMVETPALRLISDAIVRCMRTPNGRLAISMPPQEGKTSLTRAFVAWALAQNADLPVIYASYNQSMANRSGRAIRQLVESHAELGLTIASDNGAAGDWTIQGKTGGVRSAGRGAGISGVPAGLVVIDDPFKEQEAYSETIREEAWAWWTDGVSARFGADTKVLVVHTRWHTDDLIGRLLRLDAHAGWEYLNIPAEAVDAETDPLGREPGEFMVSAQGRSREQWELRKATAGPKAWQALYQGAPTTAEGDTFKRADWKRWRSLPESIGADGAHWLSGMDAIVSSWDLTFKGSATSDWCVGQVWAFRGAEAFLVHQVRARMAYPDQVAAVRAIAALYPQARPHLVEDKANGSAVLATLSTQVPGLVPVDPQRSKVVRANAVTPFVHAGNVWLPADDVRPWAAELVEEAAGFPLTAHDDQVDAMSQALSWRYLSGQYHAPDPNAVVFPDIG